MSKVGNLSPGTPTAAISTVGQPYTTDSSGVLHTTVRAGADVILTGVNSFNGANDAGVPIIGWVFAQTNPGNNPVELIERTATTYSFTAPQVTAETQLTFSLTVTSASGGTATAQAIVTVEPVRDADRFLTYLNTTNAFTVTAVTTTALPASAQASYTYAITVTKLVSYTDQNGVVHTAVPAGTPVVYNGAWTAALGSGGSNCADARNPQTLIPIPRLNLDDKLYDSSGQYSGQRLSDVMQTSDLDLASVAAQIQIAATSALPGSATAELCIPGQNTVAASLTVGADDLLTAANAPTALFDTLASTAAYYGTIDPQSTKTTLSAWLNANGFNSAVSGWAADTHAVYTNNYDLGFGRDMYMKVGACDAGFSAAPLSQFSGALSAATAQTLQGLIGHCDVAAVVVNYASMQGAAEHINAVIAVAMEYSAAPGTGARFTKFYVFAPDTLTGVYQRVSSVDLDHRGQKPVPQACVVCHGGLPAKGGSGAMPYPSSAPSNIPGDVNAGFLSWDLDSFWYSDTDPGFSQKPGDASARAQYTRANQLDQLKLLNVGAYLTTADPNRFALERELLEGWYGGPGLPGAFDGTFVPPLWQPGTNANPADSNTVYTNAFARQCRMCHIMQAPPAGVDPRTTACTAASKPAASDQQPMGCYWELANAPNLAQRLSDGAMPFARRTNDRLWVMPDGSASAGALLRTHFAAQTPPVAIATPGTSIARFNFNTTQIPPAAPPTFPENNTAALPLASPDIGDAIRLDATASAFPDAVSWTVNACTGTYSNPGACSRSLPLVGPDNVLGWFVVDDTVTYQLTLALDNDASAVGPYYFQVPVITPQFVGTPLSLQASSTTPVPLASVISQYGNGGMAGAQILLQAGADLTVVGVPAACTTAPTGCPASSIPSGGFSLQSGATSEQTSLGITVTGLGTHSQNSESLTVYVLSALQPPALTVLSPVTANMTSATNYDLVSAVNPSAFPSCKPNTLQVVNLSYTGGRTSTHDYTSPPTLSYTPAPGFATYNRSGVQQAVTQEDFTYQLSCTLLNGNPTTSASTGTFRIPVWARVSFSDLQNVWLTGTPCSGCHNGSGAPPLGSASYTELSTGNTHDTIGTVAADSNQTALSAIGFVDLSSLPTDLSSVPKSALLCWPQEGCGNTHSGSNLSGNANLTTIQYWIEDGANNF